MATNFMALMQTAAKNKHKNQGKIQDAKKEEQTRHNDRVRQIRLEKEKQKANRIDKDAVKRHQQAKLSEPTQSPVAAPSFRIPKLSTTQSSSSANDATSKRDSIAKDSHVNEHAKNGYRSKNDNNDHHHKRATLPPKSMSVPQPSTTNVSTDNKQTKSSGPNMDAIMRYKQRQAESSAQAEQRKQREKEELIKARIANNNGKVSKRMADQLQVSELTLKRLVSTANINEKPKDKSKSELNRMYEDQAKRYQQQVSSAKPKQQVDSVKQKQQPDRAKTTTTSQLQRMIEAQNRLLKRPTPTFSHMDRRESTTPPLAKVARKNAAPLNFSELMREAEEKKKKRRSSPPPQQSSSSSKSLPDPTQRRHSVPQKPDYGKLKKEKRRTDALCEQTKSTSSTTPFQMPSTAAEMRKMIDLLQQRVSQLERPASSSAKQKPQVPVQRYAHYDARADRTKAVAVSMRRTTDDNDDDDDDDEDSFDDSFIDDTPLDEENDFDEREELKRTLKKLYDYDREKYANEPKDDGRYMEARYHDCEAEEKRSARLGIIEDLQEAQLGRSRALR